MALGLAAAALAFSMPYPAAAEPLPAPLVHLRAVDPTILQDMRYAGANNFTGSVLPGYAAAECILTRPTAQALARVQADLKRAGFSLKVYDCYRPVRAVAAFAAWSRQPADDTLRRYHPATDKRRLFELGYISEQSGHSRGNTVDLTLVRLPVQLVAAFDPERAYAACTAANVAQREPDTGLDMGTAFDCFDPASSTNSREITSVQRQARQRLVSAMQRRGFRNYAKEWWHFTFNGAETDEPLDVPVSAYTAGARP